MASQVRRPFASLASDNIAVSSGPSKATAQAKASAPQATLTRTESQKENASATGTNTTHLRWRTLTKQVCDSRWSQEQRDGWAEHARNVAQDEANERVPQNWVNILCWLQTNNARNIERAYEMATNRMDNSHYGDDRDCIKIWLGLAELQFRYVLSHCSLVSHGSRPVYAAAIFARTQCLTLSRLALSPHSLPLPAVILLRKMPSRRSRI
jgi:hypothetical protein